MTNAEIVIPDDVLTSVSRALSTWDRRGAQDRARRAEELRKEFVELFPLSAWPDMQLEDYALGQETVRGTVGWWLEFNTRDVASISGGSSFKHLIFKGSNGHWRFPKQYETVEEAWGAVRAGFVESFRLAQDDRFDEIFDLRALYGAPAVRGKALYMYFPEKFVPVFSSVHISHFLHALGQNYDSTWVLGSNLTLLRTLRSIPVLSDLSNQELGYFLYHWSDPRTATRVFKIAPGEQARYWDDCLRDGYICVGWDDVGDLSSFSSKDDFRRSFGATYTDTYGGNESVITRKANELWTLMTLEPGDRVVANRGTSEILAVGTVTEDGYQFRPDRSEYRHTVSVDWDTSLSRTIPPVGAWRTRTVREVGPAEYREWFGSAQIGAQESIAVDAVYTDVEQALERRGQVILYGPPGTGKTYIARRAATWFLNGGSTTPVASMLLSDDAALAAREHHLSQARDTSPQVWFMVANPQQWSWENLFVDGSVEYSYGRLQRNFPNVRAGDLVIGYSSSPAKRIVALARVTAEFDPSADATKALTLEPVARVTDGLTYDDMGSDPLLVNSEPMRYRCQGTLFALTSIEADRILLRLSESDPTVAEIAQASVPRLTRVTFHPSYTYEDFVEGFRPHPTGAGGLELRLTDGVFKKVCAAAAAAPDQSFVLLIDEINRGNIAKIFGELITLIEHDKRGLTVRLPQSGDDFMVPPNVFIIATMNTADRSIQLLDTALRRRFRFIELMPDSEVLEGVNIGGLVLSAFLDGLNERIRQKVGRERQIGHAVFFQDGKVIGTPEAFGEVFRHELLPLLQEYLYDSYGDLADVLSTDLIDPGRERLTAHIDDPDTLCARLAEAFGGPTAE